MIGVELARALNDGADRLRAHAATMNNARALGCTSKLRAYIERLRVRTGTDWQYDRIYVTKLGGLKAVIQAGTQRKVLRFSQSRWKASD